MRGRLRKVVSVRGKTCSSCDRGASERDALEGPESCPTNRNVRVKAAMRCSRTISSFMVPIWQHEMLRLRLSHRQLGDGVTDNTGHGGLAFFRRFRVARRVRRDHPVVERSREVVRAAHRAVRAAYLDLAADAPRGEVIDARADIDAVQADLRQRVAEMLSEVSR